MRRGSRAPSGVDPVDRCAAKSASVCSAAVGARVRDHRFGELAAIERLALRRGDLLAAIAPSRRRRSARRRAARARAAGSARRSPGRAAAPARRAPTSRRRPATPGSRRARSGSPARTGRRTAACRSAATAPPSRRRRRESSPSPSRVRGIAVRPAKRAGVPGGRRAARGVEARQLAAGPRRCAKRSLPMPLLQGSTTVSAIAVASAASTALPPRVQHRDARLRGERLRRGDDVAREDRLPARSVGQAPAADDHALRIRDHRPCRRARQSSWNASSRFLRMVGSDDDQRAAAPRRSAAPREIGRVTKTVGSPRESSMRAAQVLLHHRPEDEAEQQRRRLAARA